ncbi:anaphase-promoting complex subunit CDC26-like [Ceratina calcarata]|uniref:Anaphase-promoting complex subunit CDC26-like n=1 Tax=Ceratina calcarata TaxID=156304 RepID=A0AAJ7NBJ6_9HYME|nr:anaphase-promoting complex subunit CDC26-like [Ceratina calcarata]
MHSGNMIRRSPTRIDLRLDDLRDYEGMRTRLQLQKECEERQQALYPPVWGTKVPQSEIQERIGYMPQQNQATHTRPNI